MRISAAALLAILWWAGSASGQSAGSSDGVLTGTVRDGESNAPVESANIFISNTTLACASDAAGGFVVRGVPLGLLELVVSRVGYGREILTVAHFRPDSLHIEVHLAPALLAVPGVEVGAAVPQDWHDQLALFRRFFIGEGEMADRCTLLNPEALSFTLRSDTLRAQSDSVLEIRNLALGYDLIFVLREFAWDVRQDCGRYRIAPRFVPIAPRDGEEEREWSRRRAEAFRGSLRQFLRALYHGSDAAESFSLRSGPLEKLRQGFGHAVRLGDITVVRNPAFPVAEVRFPGYLRVHYGVEPAEGAPLDERRDRFGRPLEASSGPVGSDASLIVLKAPSVLIDSLGNLLDPFSVEVSGLWARCRAWSLLPMEYRELPR
jgi:hypothetical protein